MGNKSKGIGWITAIVEFIVCVLLIAALAVAIAVTYRYTNGFNEDFKTFLVQYNGVSILADETQMTFEKGKLCRLDVKYPFDGANEKREYSVIIMPNVEKDFDYCVDGSNYAFSDMGDLSGVFTLVKHDSYFEFVIPVVFSMNEVIKRVHGGQDIEFNAESVEANPYPFRLQVSSYNEKITYKIDFTFDGMIAAFSDQPEEGGNPSVPGSEYEIFLDSLGSGGLEMLDIDCPGKAAAGEKVTFTVTVRAEFADLYFVSGVSVFFGSGEEYITDLQRLGGDYSFVMPDKTLMDKEENQGCVCIMIYIDYL